ncbi:conserved protein of unknown function [Bradyrhizobium vignae]|uniref:Uncharacterized protein n=1 Tax=Bradyrhizobium vignae TaxID=1549949 RepID=A0A2U3Q7F4_9BRAD|nr:conserved protein of unknown function [Bradyrhizobium vignae]
MRDPVWVLLFLRHTLPKISAASDCVDGIADWLHGTKAHPVADIRQNVAATSRPPFVDQEVDFPAQIHLRQGPFCAVVIALDEVAHRRLDVGHLKPQGSDFTSNFINSVVHALLEQNKNI